jgi:ribonuclease P protein component
MKQGFSRRAGPLSLQFCPNGLDVVRLAQVIPKRLARRAVDRNRIRRQVRETLRLKQSPWAGYDCVVRLRSAFTPDDDYRALAERLVAGGPGQPGR